MNAESLSLINIRRTFSGTTRHHHHHQATLNTLNAARSAGVDHFILLSAFCVRKPILQFQHAKLKFEQALTGAGDIKYSIVRPNAYFKSVSGQLELLQQGWPFVMFGDGSMCKCNPIAESDLATFMINCVEEPDKWNRVMDLGGPDEGRRGGSIGQSREGEQVRQEGSTDRPVW